MTSSISLSNRGVSNIRLVDFDYVTLSSLNRHATALLSDVGTPKVTCIERTLKQISKWIRVDSRVEIWRKEQGSHLLEGADWVIGALPRYRCYGLYPHMRKLDAIDNITTKVDLLKYCHDHNIKVRSFHFILPYLDLILPPHLADLLVYGRRRKMRPHTHPDQ